MTLPCMQMHYTYRPSRVPSNARWSAYRQSDGRYKVNFSADWVSSTEWVATDFRDLLLKIDNERIAYETAVCKRFPKATEDLILA